MTCRKFHALPSGVLEGLVSARDFADRHPGHELRYILPADEARHELMRGNADVKTAYTTENTMTVTNLHSLASSPTAGWTSGVEDNTATKYIDAIVMVVLDPANTAAANSKAFFIYAYGGTATGDLTTTAAASGGTPGAQGALTFPDVTTNPIGLPVLGIMPYLNADVVQKSKPMSICRAFDVLWLPAFWGVAVVNHSGAALAASGNTVKWRGQFATVE